ncbi:MAG: hypothetical protein JSV65_15500 [Armatimonadota bacterium]|nr:MAG: hypothetical protein JSV65_15500 [Armatimonadota bacterium]
MKRLQVIPEEGFNLYGALTKREVEHRRRARGTFYRSGAKKKDQATWAHDRYVGRIKLQRGMGEIVLAEVRTKADPEQESRLLGALLGFLDRHFREHVAAINIQFAE